jgi:hypothetical protein
VQLRQKERPLEESPLRREVRVEDIVEPAVWISDVACDDPNMDYTRWRDVLFASSGTSEERLKREA